MEKRMIYIKQNPIVTVEVKSAATILPNDYALLGNKPSINGIVVEGKLSADDLNLLSNLLDAYELNSLGDIKNDENNFLIIINGDKPIKIPVGELIDVISSVDTGKRIVIEENEEITAELKPGVFYDFVGEITALKIKLSDALQHRENEYKGQFKVGESIPQVTFPSDISWAGGEFPELLQNKVYQFSILNKIGVIVGI